MRASLLDRPSGSGSLSMGQVLVCCSVALAALMSVSAGCQHATVRVPDGPVLLPEMREDPRPYFWVGESFEELELTYARPYANRRSANLLYGRCEPRTRWFGERACTPPLSIQNVLCRSGKVNVAIFGDGGGRAARAAKALRPLNDAARALDGPMITFDRSVDC
jgi:hypothetical protein